MVVVLVDLQLRPVDEERPSHLDATLLERFGELGPDARGPELAQRLALRHSTDTAPAPANNGLELATQEFVENRTFRCKQSKFAMRK